MNILVVGCDMVGLELAVCLWKEGHDVAVIDREAENFRRLPHDFNGLTVVGVPIDQEVLKEAGIEQADAVAAVTTDDEVNIMVCQVAKHIFNKDNVIARIYNPKSEEVFHHFGLDTICPTNLIVDYIQTRITERLSEKLFTIDDEVFTYKYIGADKDMIGKKFTDIVIDEPYMLLGLRRGNDMMLNPVNEFVKEDDSLLIIELVS